MITQNLQGFTKERRMRWLRGWKQRADTAPADVIFVQDTHIRTEKEIEEVMAMWNLVLGIKTPTHPTSYWTVMDESSGGVGILMQPQHAEKVKLWKQEEWTGRRLALQFNDWTLINIYAPAIADKRKYFYEDLEVWVENARNLFLGGDFNAVLQPSLDRITKGLRSGKSCESYELNNLVEHLDLLDAVHLTTHAEEDSVPDPLSHFSFWRDHSASRIDRFYLSNNIAGVVQWAWDTFVTQISVMLKEVARQDSDRTSVYYNNLRASLNRQHKHRDDYRQTYNNARTRQSQNSFGTMLQPTLINLKRFYKRHADWQRDQTISNIVPSPGHFYPEDMSIAEKMASEWNGIVGGSHARVDPSEMEEELRKFHTVPEAQRLSPDEKVSLVNLILEDEVLSAINQLPRGKSGGTTGLSHDFFKDFKVEMAECLTMVYRAIQKGAEVPSTFLDAVVVPLRKKGDSPNAMDYRPISLLNTAYKILGRVYAERIHRFLPRIISSAQQGFVRGRLMTKSVTMVQAMLKKLIDNPELEWADSPVIVCLDEKKAYDTLDRSFMLTSLAEFGFPQAFLDVLHNLHSGTRASYMVNGEESTKWVVNSGIRQGCPLAPLLFILAIDFLGRAIVDHPEITGLEIPGSGGCKHVFNGFVDDCTVFLSASRQIEPLNHLLKRFGELSGLNVQPQKSIVIPLNAAWDQRRCHGYPVLAKGGVTSILGYQLGTHDTTQHNWDVRVQNIKKRLQVATSVTNSVKQRVMLFNAVVLPAILFTGMHIPVSKSTLRRLEQLQKRFIWKGTTREVITRHRITPGLKIKVDSVCKV
ncbi:LINE-1 retrotransposable element ORF2 protein [Phytophthora citrophthora]|uniref:LINE-1 retrotransposable element ORF2 protein n=1 Tax=Phytophthora citrophthora TaxID=4793 RepID=A0AAD9G0S0_9STRA|nr:LINE-1 retrotransposable element ORF2 protein [Phytophthora citrophthora]